MRVKITQLHKQLKAEGQTATMIYVTHDQVEAMTMGDRICVLNYGKIMQVDTPLNLYHKPANKFVAGFIGSPAMNFVDGVIEENGPYFGTTKPASQAWASPSARNARAHGSQKSKIGPRVATSCSGVIIPNGAMIWRPTSGMFAIDQRCTASTWLPGRFAAAPISSGGIAAAISPMRCG